MTAAHGDDASAAAARKRDNLLNLCDGARANVELWPREECLSPGEM